MISSNKTGSLNSNIYIYVTTLAAVLHPTSHAPSPHCLGMALVILREALEEWTLSRMEEHAKSSPPLSTEKHILFFISLINHT